MTLLVWGARMVSLRSTGSVRGACCDAQPQQSGWVDLCLNNVWDLWKSEQPQSQRRTDRGSSSWLHVPSESHACCAEAAQSLWWAGWSYLRILSSFARGFGFHRTLELRHGRSACCAVTTFGRSHTTPPDMGTFTKVILASRGNRSGYNYSRCLVCPMSDGATVGGGYWSVLGWAPWG